MRELAGGDSAVKVAVEGTDGVRMEDTVAPDALMTGADVTARRVTYLLPTPGVPRLLGVSFSTVGDSGRGGYAQITTAEQGQAGVVCVLRRRTPR